MPGWVYTQPRPAWWLGCLALRLPRRSRDDDLLFFLPFPPPRPPDFAVFSRYFPSCLYSPLVMYPNTLLSLMGHPSHFIDLSFLHLAKVAGSDVNSLFSFTVNASSFAASPMASGSSVSKFEPHGQCYQALERCKGQFDGSNLVRVEL